MTVSSFDIIACPPWTLINISACHGVYIHTGQLSNILVYSEFPVGLNTLELRVTTSAGNTANMSFVIYNAPGYTLLYLLHTIHHRIKY